MWLTRPRDSRGRRASLRACPCPTRRLRDGTVRYESCNLLTKTVNERDREGKPIVIYTRAKHRRDKGGSPR